MKQSERLGNAISNIKKMMSRHEPIMAIPRSEFIILKAISSCDGVKISDISHKLNISNAAVSQLIASLENKKLVTRIMSDKDRRIVYIKLTKEGISILKDTKELMDKFMDILVDKLGNEDSEELIRILSKLETLLKDGGICHEINN